MQGEIELAQDGTSTTSLLYMMHDAIPQTWTTYYSPQTLGIWQTFALRINSSNGISIYHNMAAVVDQINSTLSTYFFDRNETNCRIANSWFTADGYSDIQVAGLLIYDMAMTQYEFDTVHSYINSLPVTDPPLLSTAKVRCGSVDI